MNPSKVLILLLAVALPAALATVTNAKTGADLQNFSATNIKNNHTYGLFFTEKDEGFLSTITGIFTSDKEAEFKDLFVDTDKMSLLNINVGNKELKDYAGQMGITQFPYIVVYFNGERDHNIHGPANKETATQILNELQRITPKPVSLNTTKTTPVNVTAKNVPAESKDAHDAHGSPSAALEAKVTPAAPVGPKPAAPVQPPKPMTQPAKPAAQPAAAAKPATPVPAPTPAQPLAAAKPAPAPAQPVQAANPVSQPSQADQIKPKQVGQFIHESPRHEPGYIEEVDQDDILPENVWARQVLSALPEIVYDIYPEPHQATPIQEIPVQYIVPEVYVPEVIVEAPHVTYQPQPQYVAQPQFVAQPPQFAPQPHFVQQAPAFYPPMYGPGPWNAPSQPAAPAKDTKPAPTKAAAPSKPAASKPAPAKPTATPSKPATAPSKPVSAPTTKPTTNPTQYNKPIPAGKNGLTMRPIGSTTEKLATKPPRF